MQSPATILNAPGMPAPDSALIVESAQMVFEEVRCMQADVSICSTGQSVPQIGTGAPVDVVLFVGVSSGERLVDAGPSIGNSSAPSLPVERALAAVVPASCRANLCVFELVVNGERGRAIVREHGPPLSGEELASAMPVATPVA